MKRCRRCLIPDSRPDTAFVDGICSACLTHDVQASIDWVQRRKDLTRLLEHQKPNGSGYDCIVASSGGKDSHAQVLNLLCLGASPLIVTATTCMLTEIGRKNIDNLKRYAPTIEVTPNQDIRAKLNYLGLTLVGDISWPEHVAIFTTPMRMAVALGIPLVFYGENPQAQYGGPLGSEEAREMTYRWVTEFGGFLGLRTSDMVGQMGITTDDMLPYAFPDPKFINKLGCQAHFLGQYLGPWDSHRNAEKAIEAGMVAELPCLGNWWGHENLDNAMTGLHDYVMLKKYGYGRACAQLSVDIRFGRIKRDAALEICKEKEWFFPHIYAGIPVETVYERVGVTADEFSAIVKRFTTDHGAGA